MQVSTPFRPEPAHTLAGTVIARAKRARARLTIWTEQDRYWQIKASVVLCLFSLLISFPEYDTFFVPSRAFLLNMMALKRQFAHPFVPQVYEAKEHISQIGLRLTIPVISHLLHLPVKFWVALQPLAGVGFVYMLLRILARKMGGLEALTLAAGLACTYLVKAFFFDVCANFDCYSYLVILSAMYVRSLPGAGVLYLAALFCDERAYVVLPFVLMARLIYHYDDLPRTLKAWLASPELYLCLAILTLGVGLRFFLYQQFGLSTGASSAALGLATVRTNYQILPLGLVSGLDFYMLLVFIPALFYLVLRQWLLAVLLASYAVASLASMTVVLDLTRATAYLFPAAIGGVLLVFRHEQASFASRVNGFLAFAAAIFPPIFVIGTTIFWMGPVVPKIFKIIAVVAGR